VSKNPPELYKTIRALVNDPQGRVWSEEQLDIFIDEAGNLLPRMTVSLMALSRGMLDMAARMSAWPGVEYEIAQGYIILRNDERYGPFSEDRISDEAWKAYPAQLKVFGTKEQAEWVADQLSNWHAGCEHFYYVKE
jgi:hypothetical protein